MLRLNFELSQVLDVQISGEYSQIEDKGEPHRFKSPISPSTPPTRGKVSLKSPNFDRRELSVKNRCFERLTQPNETGGRDFFEHFRDLTSQGTFGARKLSKNHRLKSSYSLNLLAFPVRVLHCSS